MSRIVHLLEEGIETELFSGAVAVVGSSDGIESTVAVGTRNPKTGASITEETIFDVASLTKPIVTTTVILRLVERGVVALSDTLGDLLPAVTKPDRKDVQLHHLLTHTSGLHNYYYDPEWDSAEAARTDFFGRSLMEAEPGSRFKYGCNNFVHLGHVARQVTGESLERLAERYVFEPVGMEYARMGALDSLELPIAVTYEHNYAERPLEGEIHDPIARKLGGESGNAGLFATAPEVARFALSMLESTSGDGDGILSRATLDRLSDNWTPDMEQPHGLGWRLAQNLRPAPTWSKKSIGHTGYTGTSLWIDLTRDRFASLLTNEVYYGKNDRMSRFRERFYGIAGANR
jgi:CubicO group peptidase (beta-lactamase class C family)